MNSVSMFCVLAVILASSPFVYAAVIDVNGTEFRDSIRNITGIRLSNITDVELKQFQTNGTISARINQTLSHHNDTVFRNMLRTYPHVKVGKMSEQEVQQFQSTGVLPIHIIESMNNLNESLFRNTFTQMTERRTVGKLTEEEIEQFQASGRLPERFDSIIRQINKNLSASTTTITTDSYDETENDEEVVQTIFSLGQLSDEERQKFRSTGMLPDRIIKMIQNSTSIEQDFRQAVRSIPGRPLTEMSAEELAKIRATFNLNNSTLMAN